MKASAPVRAQALRRRIARAQIGVLNRTSTATIVPLVLVVCLVALTFGHWTGLDTALPWAAVMSASCIAIALVGGLGVERARTDREFDRWRVLLVVAHSSAQLCWASVGLVFWVPGDSINNALVLLVMTAAMAPAIGWASVYLPLMYGWVAIPGAMLVLRASAFGETMALATAGAAVVYLAFLTLLGRRLNRVITDLFALRQEREALILKLQREKTVAEQERARAQQASQSKSAFIASVSHELRTPLNAIIGFSDVMREETFGALGHANYKQYADDIHNSGRHLLSLIGDILDFARIEAGRLELDEEPVDLVIACEECARMVEITAGNRGIAVRTDVPRRLPRIVADERAIRQIWLNLASNALKFTDTGGEIELFADLNPAGTIVFGVRDTGCGMDEEELDRVMEAFAQGRTRARTGERGTGLGLAIVNGLAEAHGGYVDLQSRVGEGTTASIVLPRARVVSAELERRETA